ncbi:MAG: class I SAM-dependent methyltransferase [Anaerolineae bacterium]
MNTNSDENQTLNAQVQAIWEQNAAYWDERMGEGNLFQRLLVGPASERLLEVRPDEYVLEIGCGNGVFARRMAQLGARVLATDFAEQMLVHARARSTEHADRIEYRQVDGTQAEQLAALGEHRFDAVVSNMVIMDMAAIAPLMNAIPHLLKPRGRFVFTLMHPCFNHSGTGLVAEEWDVEGNPVTTYSVKVSRYKSVGTTKGLALAGQPRPQFYFHRTLADLLTPAFAAGLVIDGIEEPTFESREKGNRWLGWADFTEIPPVLGVRLRVAG